MGSRFAVCFAVLLAAAGSVHAAQSGPSDDPSTGYPVRPNLLPVGPALPVNSVREMLDYGRANPGKLTLATSGGYAHFSAELFHHLSGLQMLVVVYKGGFPAMVDVMAGQAHINLGSLIQSIPYTRSGKLKPLATSGARRAAAAPEEVRKMLPVEIAKWANVAKVANIRGQ